MENFPIEEQSGFAATRSASCFGRKVSLNASCRSSRQDAEMENFPIEIGVSKVSCCNFHTTYGTRLKPQGPYVV